MIFFLPKGRSVIISRFPNRPRPAKKKKAASIQRHKLIEK
jgi:hypothetical protein